MTDRLAEIKANHDRDIRTHNAMGIELPRQCKEIDWLIAEVERLNIVLSESIGKNGQAVVRQCVFCQREFTRFACESRMHCRGCERT